MVLRPTKTGQQTITSCISRMIDDLPTPSASPQPYTKNNKNNKKIGNPESYDTENAGTPNNETLYVTTQNLAYKKQPGKERKKRRKRSTNARRKKMKQKKIRTYFDSMNQTPEEDEQHPDEIEYDEPSDTARDEDLEIRAQLPDWKNDSEIECKHGNNVKSNVDDNLRLYFQNFNGINTSFSTTEFLDELTILKDLEVDVILGAESNINWKQNDNINKTKNVVKKVWSKCKLATGNLKERTKSDFQPGGTFAISTGKWVSHAEKSGSDDLGRWTWVTHRGKNNRLVTFISAYRVCQNKLSTAGPSTCWMQQWRALRKRGVEKPDPRSAMLTDLRLFIEELIKKNHEIVLGIDANEDLRDGTRLKTTIQQLDLVDAYESMHPNSVKPTTYLRGSKQIDFVFISPGLIPALKGIGYLPFHMGVFSDHCAVFADFDPSIMFLGDIHSALEPATRKLLASNPKRADNYTRILVELFEYHKILERTIALQQKFQHGLKHLHECIEEYNQLDSEITEYMLSAERRCCKNKSGYAWSLKLVEAACLVRYWKLRKSAFLNNTEFDYTNNLAYYLNITDDPSLTISEIDKELTKARKALKAAQKNAEALRDEHLEELAKMVSHKRPGSIESIIKNIKHCEELRTAFKQMAPITKEVQGGQVKHIQVPTTTPIHNSAMYGEVAMSLAFDHNAPYTTIDDSDEVIQRLLQRNQLHLNQAYDTPFATKEMSEYIGEHGTGQGAQDILDGKFNPNLTDNLPAVNYWIKHHLRRAAPQASIPVTLSVQEFKAMMHKQDESTSSSPSGRHYGHYKAVIDFDDICQVHCLMMTMPFQFGFTPARWCKSIDVMLEKDPGEPKIHRLRIIVIVEGDMNAIMKVIWNRRLVPRAEETKFVSPVQFGNRKGKTALDALLLKIVTMDSIRLFRLNGGILNNDATACYDRMIPSLTSIHLQGLGLSKEAAQCSVLLNKNMKHYVRTAKGESSEFYADSEECRKFGEGQGKTSSPPNWQFTSSTILNALHKKVQGLKILSVCKNYIADRVAEAYVDDVDGAVVDQTNQEKESKQSIASKMSELTQTWADLLFGSGGELSLKKSYWWLIWWKWEDGKASLSTKEESNEEVYIRSGRDTHKQKLKRKDATDSLRQLGF